MFSLCSIGRLACKLGKARGGSELMSQRIGHILVSVSFVCLIAFIAGLPEQNALAQANRPVTPAQAALTSVPRIEQMALTEKHIKGMLAASKEVDHITDSAPEDINKLKPETVAKLDEVARRCGLASYAEYLRVKDNVYLALAGYDRVAKKYVGYDAVVKAEIARIKADRKMSAFDKQEKITDLNDSLQPQFRFPPVKYKANIGLALKYDDLISSTMRAGD
jgi:hypothetical protein